jgi:hypothetical protein
LRASYMLPAHREVSEVSCRKSALEYPLLPASSREKTNP